MTHLLLLGPFYSIQTKFLYFFAHDCSRAVGRSRNLKKKKGKGQVLSNMVSISSFLTHLMVHTVLVTQRLILRCPWVLLLYVLLAIKYTQNSLMLINLNSYHEGQTWVYKSQIKNKIFSLVLNIYSLLLLNLNSYHEHQTWVY